MATINKSILSQFFVDADGNVISIKINDEQQQVSSINYTITLGGIPEEFNRVICINKGTGEIFTEVNSLSALESGCFYVDYQLGKVYFDSSDAGKVVLFSYYSQGYEMISSERIFDQTAYDENKIITTIQDIIDTGRAGIDYLNSIGDASVLIKQLEDQVTIANTAKSNLQSTISQANTLNTNLQNKVTQGETLIQDLTTINETSENAKISLNGLNTTASNINDALNDTIDSANTIKTNLTNTTTTATNTNSTLNTTITNANTAKTNLETAISNGNITTLSNKIRMAEIRDNYRYVAVGVITSNKLSVLTSDNGINFNVLYKDVFTPAKGNKSLSHPSIKVVGDYFYIVYENYSSSAPNRLAFARSKDLKTWEELNLITVSSLSGKTFSCPTWIDDGGVDKISFTVNDGSNNLIYVAEYNSNSHTLTNIITFSLDNVTSASCTRIFNTGATYICTAIDSVNTNVLASEGGYINSGYKEITTRIAMDNVNYISIIPVPNGGVRYYYKNSSDGNIYFRESNFYFDCFCTSALVTNSLNLVLESLDVLDMHNISFIRKIDQNYAELASFPYTENNFVITPNSCYAVSGTTNASINGINHSLLKDGDSVYFGAFTDKGSLTIYRKDSAKVYLKESSITLEQDYVYQFIKVGGCLRLIK